jgi:LytS/YehU family sensor histidine kinase
MNSNFIFTCLNAINNFILQNETEAASGYLIKFSELIRKVLDHSQKKYISLGEELDTMELYIQLEQLRLNNHFAYHIICDPAIDMDEVMVPPLLFQPFVENAIWHGLMHQKEKGKVSITISQDHQYLLCMIEDNGIGRQKAAEINKNRRGANSLGLKITQDRIALMSNEALQENSLTITDLKNSDGESLGTRVAIKIPLIKESLPEAGPGKRPAKYAPEKLNWFRNLFLL